MSEWSVAEPRKLTFDDPVTALHVRVVNGTVNVVGTDEGSARLEVSELEGPPLLVTQQDGTLTVAYEDLPWKGFLKWLDRKGWRRSAVVTLAVPVSTPVEVGVVGAAAVVSGMENRVAVRGVTGDTTLVRIMRPRPRGDRLREPGGPGRHRRPPLQLRLRRPDRGRGLGLLRARRIGERLDDRGPRPQGHPHRRPVVERLGEIAIRLPHPADAEVEANTASGTVSSAFEDLRVSGQWGAKKITGRLGAGNGKLKAMTVSGSIAMLRRPTAEDEPHEDGSSASPETPTDKKVL